MRLGICAGHSIISPGAVLDGQTEQGWCRRVVDAVRTAAFRGGWHVLDPHSDEMEFGYPEYLIDRIETFRRSDLDAAIDVHLNASRDDTINHSLAIYGHGRTDSAALAGALAEAFAGALPWPARGPVSDAALGRCLAFVRRLSCPAVIVEPLFLSNGQARAWLRQDGSVEALADLIIRGVQTWGSSVGIVGGGQAGMSTLPVIGSARERRTGIPACRRHVSKKGVVRATGGEAVQPSTMAAGGGP